MVGKKKWEKKNLNKYKNQTLVFHSCAKKNKFPRHNHIPFCCWIWPLKNQNKSHKTVTANGTSSTWLSQCLLLPTEHCVGKSGSLTHLPVTLSSFTYRVLCNYRLSWKSDTLALCACICSDHCSGVHTIHAHCGQVFSWATAKTTTMTGILIRIQDILASWTIFVFFFSF